jgi:hypothetical protein
MIKYTVKRYAEFKNVNQVAIHKQIQKTQSNIIKLVVFV